MRKVTLDFSNKLLNLRGEPSDRTCGDMLADLISTESKGNPVKLYGWALDLIKEPAVLELDKADTKVLEALITDTERINILVKGQLLAIFDKAKEKEE